MDSAAILFEALIVPHRSLSPRGLRILMAVICLLSAVMALRFWFIGAWPVVAFSVVEIGLALFLLWLNAKRAGASELLLLVRGRAPHCADRSARPSKGTLITRRLAQRCDGRAAG